MFVVWPGTWMGAGWRNDLGLMSARRLVPARLGTSPSGHAPGVPYAPEFDDVYHSVAGAWAQARHVFMAGNGLPGRWQHRDRFVILETGFGLGNNFLATWAAWLKDPNRCHRLFFISIEKHPLTLDDLQRVHRERPLDEDHAEASALATRLTAAWPVLTPGLHCLEFDEPEQHGVTLLLGLGDIKTLLPQIMAQVDAFYLDGFAPAKNADMWDSALLSRLDRLCAPGATAATWSVARSVRDGLQQAGFVTEKAAGFQGKRDMLTARFEPASATYHQPRPLPGGLWPSPPTAERQATVIGAGLAGCAAAWALTREGWQVTLLDRQAEPAQETSGNAGGLFHSIVHGDDGVHARAHRAAALFASHVLKPWVDHGTLPGQCQGLLRLDKRMNTSDAQALLEHLGWPADHLQWLEQAQASEAAQLPLPHGAWWFKQGGWVSPAAYSRHMLAQAQATGRLTLRMGTSVDRIALDVQNGQTVWRLSAADGQPLNTTSQLVLCCAAQAHTWLGQTPFGLDRTLLPTRLVRGQVSLLNENTPGLRRPAMPVAGQGYAIALNDGRVLFGATTQTGDMDEQVRASDHVHNLLQARELGLFEASMVGLNESDATTLDTELAEGLEGRVGWRVGTADRLPLVGALPHVGQMAQTHGWPEQIRRVPRWRTDEHGRPGLFMFGGLGSRGIAWAALGGRLLAHWMSGSPCPVEVELRDALDPARFGVRVQRKQANITAC